MGEGTLTTPDGRTLAYVARGAGDGFPVIVSHGTPGSRFARHPDEASTNATACGGRVRPARLWPLRPAARPLGRRRARRHRGPRRRARLRQYAVVGGSGGAPHALACGALLADRVVRVGALVTPAPPDAENFDFYEGLAELNVKEFGAAVEGRKAIEAFLEPYVDGIRADPDDVIEQILSELPGGRSAACLATGVPRGHEGVVHRGRPPGLARLADDDLAFAKPWGFDLDDVTVETRVWQGELDVLTPRPHGEYVASRLPRRQVRAARGWWPLPRPGVDGRLRVADRRRSRPAVSLSGRAYGA